jgi:hypothetical protein
MGCNDANCSAGCNVARSSLGCIVACYHFLHAMEWRLCRCVGSVGYMFIEKGGRSGPQGSYRRAACGEGRGRRLWSNSKRLQFSGICSQGSKSSFLCVCGCFCSGFGAGSERCAYRGQIAVVGWRCALTLERIMSPAVGPRPLAPRTCRPSGSERHPF